MGQSYQMDILWKSYKIKSVPALCMNADSSLIFEGLRDKI
jgi:hypothetical protein